jgi:hypothetical protein
VCVAAGKDVPGRVLWEVGLTPRCSCSRCERECVSWRLPLHQRVPTVVSLQGKITGYKWFIDMYMESWNHRMTRAMAHRNTDRRTAHRRACPGPGTVLGSTIAT